MSDDKYFNVQQSSKLADYLKKFDTAPVKSKSLPIGSGDQRKRKISVEDDSRFSSKYVKKQQPDKRTIKGDLATARIGQQKAKNEDSRGDKLRNQCVEKLMQSQFRNINQYLYENPTVQAIRYMTPDLFHKYHESYSQLVAKWPIKPLGRCPKPFGFNCSPFLTLAVLYRRDHQGDRKVARIQRTTADHRRHGLRRSAAGQTF